MNRFSADIGSVDYAVPELILEFILVRTWPPLSWHPLQLELEHVNKVPTCSLYSINLPLFIFIPLSKLCNRNMTHVSIYCARTHNVGIRVGTSRLKLKLYCFKMHNITIQYNLKMNTYETIWGQIPTGYMANFK